MESADSGWNPMESIGIRLESIGIHGFQPESIGLGLESGWNPMESLGLGLESSWNPWILVGFLVKVKISGMLLYSKGESIFDFPAQHRHR